jgi:hypothetical protein
MNKALLFAVAVATAALAGSQPARAYYDAPWCAVYSIGHGSSVERCEFRNIESCRVEIIAGNRGFCRQNQYFQGYSAPAPRTRRPR